MYYEWQWVSSYDILCPRYAACVVEDKKPDKQMVYLLCKDDAMCLSYLCDNYSSSTNYCRQLLRLVPHKEVAVENSHV